MSMEAQARALMTRHHHTIKNRQQSLLGRSAAAIGMGVEASRYWNHIQGKPHPTFSTSYSRSGASLS